jgi:hypothetical protein
VLDQIRVCCVRLANCPLWGPSTGAHMPGQSEHFPSFVRYGQGLIAALTAAAADGELHDMSAVVGASDWLFAAESHA